MTTVFKHRHAKINALRPLSTETRDHYQHETRAIDETYIASEYVPSRLAQAEWQARGVETPKLQDIRLFRLGRIRQKLQELDYAGIVVVVAIVLVLLLCLYYIFGHLEYEAPF